MGLPYFLKEIIRREKMGVSYFPAHHAIFLRRQRRQLLLPMLGTEVPSGFGIRGAKESSLLIDIMTIR